MRSTEEIEKAIFKELAEERIALARKNLLAFVTFTKEDYQINWHHQQICRVLQDFVNRKIDRLILEMPPRTGKTEIISRRLPAFLFGLNPNEKIICTSYSDDLASRNNRDVQRIIDSPFYAQIFPNTRLGGKNARSTQTAKYLRNSDLFEIVNHNGSYRSAGVGGGITGMGANTIIVDDPFKNREEANSLTVRNKIFEWYGSTLYSRLEKNGRVIIVNTRWHEDDLTGRLITNQPGEWTKVSFPMIKETDDNPKDPREIGEPLWPEKYDLATCMRIKESVGAQNWASLYQQSPTIAEGSAVKRSWLKNFYRELPAQMDVIVQSWDLTFKESAKSDYVVGMILGRKNANYYLIDILRDRMDFPSQIRAFQQLSAKWPQAQRKLVEAKANGEALIATLKNDIAGIVPVHPKDSKEQRLASISPIIESGNVYLPDPLIAPCLNDFIEELVGFPNKAHDDQVDAFTQGISDLAKNQLNYLKKLVAL